MVPVRRGVRRRGVARRGVTGVKLVAFFVLGRFVHGPLSPLLPTAFETTLLYYVRFYPAWLLALVGTVGASLAEALYYWLVDRAAELPTIDEFSTTQDVMWCIVDVNLATIMTPDMFI